MSRSEIEKAAEMEKSKAVRTLNSLIELHKNYRPESAFACCICHVLYAKYRI